MKLFIFDLQTRSKAPFLPKKHVFYPKNPFFTAKNQFLPQKPVFYTKNPFFTPNHTPTPNTACKTAKSQKCVILYKSSNLNTHTFSSFGTKKNFFFFRQT